MIELGKGDEFKYSCESCTNKENNSTLGHLNEAGEVSKQNVPNIVSIVVVYSILPLDCDTPTSEKTFKSGVWERLHEDIGEVVDGCAVDDLYFVRSSAFANEMVPNIKYRCAGREGHVLRLRE